jgi:hypothetical protein
MPKLGSDKFLQKELSSLDSPLKAYDLSSVLWIEIEGGGTRRAKNKKSHKSFEVSRRKIKGSKQNPAVYCARLF